MRIVHWAFWAIGVLAFAVPDLSLSKKAWALFQCLVLSFSFPYWYWAAEIRAATGLVARGKSKTFGRLRYLISGAGLLTSSTALLFSEWRRSDAKQLCYMVFCALVGGFIVAVSLWSRRGPRRTTAPNSTVVRGDSDAKPLISIGIERGTSYYSKSDMPLINFPGGHFKSWEAAVAGSIAFATPGSRESRLEFGGRYYRHPDGWFSYTFPTPGKADEIDMATTLPIPQGTEPAGGFHIHWQDQWYTGPSNEDMVYAYDPDCGGPFVVGQQHGVTEIIWPNYTPVGSTDMQITRLIEKGPGK